MPNQMANSGYDPPVVQYFHCVGFQIMFIEMALTSVVW